MACLWPWFLSSTIHTISNIFQVAMMFALYNVKRLSPISNYLFSVSISFISLKVYILTSSLVRNLGETSRTTICNIWSVIIGKKLFTRAKLMAELDKQHREVPLKKTQNGIRMFIDWTLRIAFILSIGWLVMRNIAYFIFMLYLHQSG